MILFLSTRDLFQLKGIQNKAQMNRNGVANSLCFGSSGFEKARKGQASKGLR